ncbi:C2H2-type domain-containing protein [Fusarium sp. Ph1]|nr:C2H2-type domain-containing protein [Fusarium sp. Ph1]
MPPRHQTLPPAQTSSAREAQKSFYCQLCSKGYSRMNDYEAHLSSYDHSHKQRLKDMKAMVRDPNAGSRARKAEAKADGLISIKLPGQEGANGNSGGGGGFKKGGFKKSGFKSAFTKVEGSASGTSVEKPKPTNVLEPAPTNPGLQKNLSAESDTEDEGYEVYDPRFPTD